jgi:hypothetical protein
MDRYRRFHPLPAYRIVSDGIERNEIVFGEVHTGRFGRDGEFPEGNPVLVGQIGALNVSRDIKGNVYGDAGPAADRALGPSGGGPELPGNQTAASISARTAVLQSTARHSGE